MIKRKRIVLLTLFLFLALCFFHAIYEKYYKIDFTDYHYIHFLAHADSPDQKHAVGVTVYKKDINDDIVYLCAILYNNDADIRQQGSNIILWDCVQASKVESGRSEPERLQFSIYAEWIDNKNILIHGTSYSRIIHIDKGYDYRRN